MFYHILSFWQAPVYRVAHIFFLQVFRWVRYELLVLRTSGRIGAHNCLGVTTALGVSRFPFLVQRHHPQTGDGKTLTLVTSRKGFSFVRTYGHYRPGGVRRGKSRGVKVPPGAFFAEGGCSRPFIIENIGRYRVQYTNTACSQ